MPSKSRLWLYSSLFRKPDLWQDITGVILLFSLQPPKSPLLVKCLKFAIELGHLGLAKLHLLGARYATDKRRHYKLWTKKQTHKARIASWLSVHLFVFLSIAFRRARQSRFHSEPKKRFSWSLPDDLAEHFPTAVTCSFVALDRALHGLQPFVKLPNTLWTPCLMLCRSPCKFTQNNNVANYVRILYNNKAHDINQFIKTEGPYGHLHCIITHCKHLHKIHFAKLN